MFFPQKCPPTPAWTEFKQFRGYNTFRDNLRAGHIGLWFPSRWVWGWLEKATVFWRPAMASWQSTPVYMGSHKWAHLKRDCCCSKAKSQTANSDRCQSAWLHPLWGHCSALITLSSAIRYIFTEGCVFSAGKERFRSPSLSRVLAKRKMWQKEMYCSQNRHNLKDHIFSSLIASIFCKC